MDNNAAAGALIAASSRIQLILAFIGSFWGCVAKLLASCAIEPVSSGANPADSPSSDRPLFKVPDVDGDLAPPPIASKLRRVLEGREKLVSKVIWEKRVPREFHLWCVANVGGRRKVRKYETCWDPLPRAVWAPQMLSR